MNMRALATAMALAAISWTSCLAANGSERDTLPHATSGSITVYVQATWKGEPPRRGEGETKSLVVETYIENRGDQPVTVLLGADSQTSYLRASSSRLIVTQYVEASIELERPVKPSMTDVRGVTLAPGEQTKLPMAIVVVDKADELRELETAYVVDPEFKEWFGAWSGRIAVSVPINGGSP